MVSSFYFFKNILFQLLHIDFGYNLGKFKLNLEMKIERLPFVLAHDFVHLINKGKAKKKEFEMFSKVQNYF